MKAEPNRLIPLKPGENLLELLNICKSMSQTIAETKIGISPLVLAHSTDFYHHVNQRN